MIPKLELETLNAIIEAQKNTIEHLESKVVDADKYISNMTRTDDTLENAEARIAELEQALLKADDILSASIDVIEGGFFTKSQVDLARETRAEIKELVEGIKSD